MNWAKLILTVVTEAWEAWRSRKVEPEEPVASQRDIAIGVAAGEAARREGKIAPRMRAMSIECPKCLCMWGGTGTFLPSKCPKCGFDTAEDTWPGERK